MSENSEEEIISWQARFSKCPYCNKSIYLVSTSNESKRDAVKKLLKDLNFHFDKICESSKSVKEMPKIDIRLEKRSTNVYGRKYTAFTWETNNKLLIYPKVPSVS